MMRKITLLLVAAIGIITTDMQAQNASRLVGRHTIRFNTTWEPYDTATYVYPTNHSGDVWELSNERMNYDTSYNVAWDGTTYIHYKKNVKTFDGNNRLIERLELSINGTTETNSKKVTYTLDGNGNVTEELSQNWVSNAWENNNHILMTYDGNNNMLTQTVEYWSGTVWGSSYLSVYTYNSNNDMVSNVSATYNYGTSQYDSSYRTEQYYNTNNLSDSSRSYIWNSGWALTSHTFNYYNTNNVNTGYLVQNFVNNAWENNVRGFTLFDMNNYSCGDSSQRWLTYSSSWRNMYTGRTTFDNNVNSVAYHYDVWDTANMVFVPDYSDSMEYNSDNKVVWDKRQKWDVNTQTWVGQYGFGENRYYYEPYTAGVGSVKEAPAELVLYPVPARNSLNIQLKWNQPQDFAIVIHDMQGRPVMQLGEKASKEYKKNIPVHSLPAGNYILQIRGKENRMQQQFTKMD